MVFKLSNYYDRNSYELTDLSHSDRTIFKLLFDKRYLHTAVPIIKKRDTIYSVPFIDSKVTNWTRFILN